MSKLPGKRKKIKKRFIFLQLVTLIMVWFFVWYIDVAGDRYDLHTAMFFSEESPADMEGFTFTCEPEGIVEAGKPYLSEEREVIVPLASQKTGEAHVTIKLSVNGFDEPITREVDITVSNMGTIIEHNLYYTNFNGYQLVNMLFWGWIGLTLVVMLYSFYECVKKSDYSYRMIAYGGISLFLAVQLVIILYKILNNVVNSFSALVALVMQTGEWFVMLLLVPMLVMAVALSVSNIQLLRREGFRPANALGIGLSVVWLAGLLFTLGNNLFGGGFGQESELMSVLRFLMTFIVTYFECMLISTAVCAFLATRYTPPYDRDYIIILGCAIRRDGSLTPLLKGRADAALAFEKRQYEKTGKHACFVPSGGQGADEVISESEAMERYLLSQGVEPEYIKREDKSVNTFENMKLSKKVIEENTDDISAEKIAFSTTNYHVFRGYILAAKNGFEAKGISTKTKWYFFPNAFIREFIGLLVDQLWRHLSFIGAMILLLIAIAWIM